MPSRTRALLMLLLFSGPSILRAIPANLAPGKTATASSSDYGSVPGDIADGNRSGEFYASGSVWHTSIPDAAPWIEVDLGQNYNLDRVMLWPRTDAVQNTVKDLRIKITNNAGTVVYNTVFIPGQPASQPWGTTALRGTVGRKVRIERADAPPNPNFLTFAELEVFGQTNTIPPNLALNKPRTAASPGAYSTPVNAGNDGVIDGDYTHTGHPIFHSGVTAVGDYYEIDLSNGQAVNQEVDMVRLFNRTDFTNNQFLKLSLKNTAGVQVWTQTVNAARETLVANGRQYDITVDVPLTVQARYARVETTASEPLVFAELEVFGPEVDITPPTLVSVDPPANDLVAELYQTTVTFSENVTGVNAADLLVNNTPCTNVTAQSGSVYLFAFPQPLSGPVTFEWAAGHGIVDGGTNGFSGSSWQMILDTSLPSPRPYISEFMADNKGGLADADGETPDWIEISNPGPTTVNLGGWYLTDTPSALTKWRFPSPVMVPAGTSIVVFASSKDRRVAGAELHTNFKLDPDGESVLLVKPDGVTIASQILNYPSQEENVSYGTGRRLNAVPSVPAGAAAKVLIPAANVSGWTATVFNDSAWTDATTGVGFDQSGGMNGSGPLGYWNFNNAGTPSQAVDASGRGLTGTVLNATYTADGGGQTGEPGDRAMNFPGTGVVNVTGANSNAFDGITTANGVAISAWIYGAATQPAANFLFLAGSNSDGTGIRVLDAHLPWSDSIIYWDTAGCCDSGRQRVQIGDPNPAHWRGQWNHYVLQKNGNIKEIWQNGSLLLSGTNTDAMMNLRSLFIGAYTATGAQGYQGMIDDFAIWDGALTPAQIAALTARTATPLTVRSLTPQVSTDVSAAMRTVNASALVRIPFTVADIAGLDLLVLRMRYDDGFVAYLNGTEIARRNAPAGAVIPYNAAATASRNGSASLTVEEIDVSRYAALLTAGTNVLAVQGLNVSAADPDFLVLPELVAGSFAQGRYFSSATPGAPNGNGFAGFVADTVFFPNRGFYSTPQTVTISCATPGAIVVTTTDGSIPTLTSGTQAPSPATVNITTTTTLRAAAFVPASDLGPANVDTHTYLFVDHVPNQQRPAAAPVTWPGGAGDYVMDPRIVNGAQPGYTIHDALLAIPTLSITTTPADIWGPGGIYANSGSRGDAWERAASAEWMEPSGADGFHINFGLAIHGNISRDKSFTPKHSFKMFFRSQYGETKLRHPLFPGSPVENFDQLILRGGSTDTFSGTEWGPVPLGPGGSNYQRWARAWASYIRDQWVRDSQIAMGQASAYGRYCHLYLNGTYWGLYNVCEHPDEDFQADHLGGSASEYDVLVDFAELKSGTTTAWQQLMTLGSGSASDAAFQQMQGNNPDGTRNPAFPVLLNANSLIDYMVLHIFHGADDWPNHNWWAGRATLNTTAVNDGFHFFAWDQEISNENVIYERSSWQGYPSKYADVNAPNTPTQPYFALRQGSPEFRMKFADRVYRHLFNDGALTTAAAKARWDARVVEIDKPIVAESARWGDYQPNLINAGQPYRRQVEWLGHLNWMAANYWPQINGVALQRFRGAGLYPALNAPVISQFGGYYLPGFTAALSHANGTGVIRYTLDGSDPRLPGGAANPAALAYAAPFGLSGTQTVKARVQNGTLWSALLETTFIPHPDRDLDGVPNEWETAHGLDPDNAADASGDADGDGRTNREEYAADSDPRDGGSVFTAVAVTNPAGLHIQFTAKANRRYRLEGSDSLTDWTVMKDRNPNPVDTAVDWLLNPTAPRRFYRVVASTEP